MGSLSVMADDGEDEEEWLGYSSCTDEKNESFRPANEQEQEESPTEEFRSDISDAERLEKIREVLKSSLCDTTSAPRPSSLSSCTLEMSSVSQTNGPCEHWVWLKLVSKLNSIRQTKWNGSFMEGYYHECLKISENANPKESPEISSDNFQKNLFNFHGMKTYSSLSAKEDLYDGTNENTSTSKSHTESENGLINKDGLDRKDMLSSVDSTSELRNELSPKSDSTFEDFGAELEWSDNDVKNETVESKLSSTSEFDENEAASDLARLPYEEIIRLRNELLDYTKQYSDILVIELKNRDNSIREKELKNNFISSFLAVQAKIREATLAPSKKKFSLQSNPSSNSQTLTTTIPYEIQNGGPRPDILEKLIEIMEAMRSNSPTVPTLLTNYILKVLCK